MEWIIASMIALVGTLVVGGMNYSSATDINQAQTDVATRQNELAEETLTYNKEKDKELFEYNKWLNQMQMDREDTAVQRRAADLKAAGLSPLLAAGSAATSGAGGTLSRNQVSAPDLQAPNLQNPFASFSSLMNNAYNQSMQGYQTYLDTQKSNADVSLMKSQTYKNLADFESQRIENKYAEDYLNNRNIEMYYKAEQSINDISLQMAKLSGQERSNEYQRLKNEQQVWEVVKSQYQAKILSHDYNIYKNIPTIPTNVINAGAKTTIGQTIQDAALTAYEASNGFNSTPTEFAHVEIPTVDNSARATGYVHADEQGNLLYGHYQTGSATYFRDGFVYGGQGLKIDTAGNVWYGGQKLDPKYQNQAKERLFSAGYANLPEEWLLSTTGANYAYSDGTSVTSGRDRYKRN